MSDERVEAAAKAIFDADVRYAVPFEDRLSEIQDHYRTLATAALAAADAVDVMEVIDFRNVLDRIIGAAAEPEDPDEIDYAVEDAVLLYRRALLTNQPEPTYPPVSGGALDMDADETACGQVCQDRNDRMWAKLGPVDDVELPF